MIRSVARLLCVAFVASLTTVTSTSGAMSQSSQNFHLADVQAKVRSALGERPKSERIVTNYVSNGETGTFTEIRSGNDHRTDSTLGPFSYAHGTSGNISWRQNANGETIVTEDDEDEDQADDASPDEMTITQMTHVTAPAERYIISTLTKHGTGTKEYIDPATWFVVRRDTITPTETTVDLYSDFRATDGFTRSWKYSKSDGHKENDVAYAIASLDTAPIPADRLAVPPDARKLADFPTGKSIVQLPVQYDRDDAKFIVRVMVGDRGLDFLLDTGASGIVIDREVARQMGLKQIGAYSSAANAGRYIGTSTSVPVMKVGPLVMHDVQMDTIPDSDYTYGPYKVVGLLGFDFIDAVGLKLDYQNGSVFAYDPATYSVPSDTAALDLDVRLASNTPEATIGVNGAFGQHFTLDTGGAGAVLINDHFRRMHPDAAVDKDHVNHPVTLRGVGGDFGAKYVTLAAFTLGNVTFTDFGAYVLDDSSIYGDDDGVIGPDIFRLYTMYLDFPHRHVRMIPNDLYYAGLVRKKR